MSMQGPIATGRCATGIPSARLAVWWLLASEVFIFGGLIAVFLLYKFNGAPGMEDASLTVTWAGALNTFVLLTSSLTIVLAHDAAEHGDGHKAFKFTWITIAGGLIFMCVKAFEYYSKISHGVGFTTNIFWSFYFTMTGLHALHVMGGMIIMGLVSFDVRKGRNLQRTELVGLYWHFVDIVWIFLFPMLYIANF